MKSTGKRTLNPEEWERVKDLFVQCLQSPPMLREVFLKTALPDDSNLKNMVRELLLAYERDKAFLEKPAGLRPEDFISGGPERPCSFAPTDTDFKPVHIGKYLLIQRLDTGAMAEVYRARVHGARGFEKEVAVKCMLPWHLTNQKLERGFEQEAKLCSKLSHVNIAQVHDFIRVQNSLWLVMEYIEGKNLALVIKKIQALSTRPPVAFGVYIVAEIAKGLEYAHTRIDERSGKEHPIIHRDISPKNIMLSYEGTVKIIDFGIAKTPISPSNPKTEVGLLKGTVGYMSPEQARGEPIDTRSDIFSSSIILYELLSWEPLFSSASNKTGAPSFLPQDFTGIESRVTSIDAPSELREILLKGLSVNAHVRYQKAGELLWDLQRFLTRHASFSQKELVAFMRVLFRDEQEAQRRFNERLLEEVSNVSGQENSSFGGYAKANAENSGHRAKARTSPLVVVLLLFSIMISGLNFYYQLIPDDFTLVRAPASMPEKTAASRLCVAHIHSDVLNARVSINDVVVGTAPITVTLKCHRKFAIALEQGGDEILVHESIVQEPQSKIFLSLAGRPLPK